MSETNTTATEPTRKERIIARVQRTRAFVSRHKLALTAAAIVTPVMIYAAKGGFGDSDAEDFDTDETDLEDDTVEGDL